MRAWLRRDHRLRIIVRIIGDERILDVARSDLGGRLAPVREDIAEEALSLTCQ